MINSILNRHTDYVHFQNIKTPTDIITDQTEIKNHIATHFENWIKHKPINQHIFN